MQIISELIKYHYQQYFKTSKFVMPFAALIVILYTLYSSKPVGVVPSLISCCIFVFLIASWIGITICSLEDPISEQIIILRIKSHKKHYVYHTLFLLSLSTLIALISIAVPVLLNIINKDQLFDRALLPADILSGIVLLTVSAFIGCSLGELSHPRMIKDRKAAVLFVFLIDIISMIKTMLLSSFPFSRVILWTVPPIAGLPMKFGHDSYFSIEKVAGTAVVLFVYGSTLALLRICYLSKQKF